MLCFGTKFHINKNDLSHPLGHKLSYVTILVQMTKLCDIKSHNSNHFDFV